MHEQHLSTPIAPIVVYETGVSGVPQVLALLHQAGLHPRTLDDPDPIILHESMGTYVVRIAVPTEEADHARSVLSEMEAASAPVVDALDRRVKGAFRAACVAAAASACLFRLFRGSWEEVPWLLVVAIGATALLLVGNKERLTNLLHRR